MNERIIRFAYAGSACLLATLFGFWFFGGEIFLNKLSNDKLIAILIPIITSPLIGFLLSSIIKGIVDLIFFERSPFLKPNEKIKNNYLEKIFIKYGDNSGITKDINSSNYNIEKIEFVYTCHQLILRNNESNKEIIEYASRRLDYFWMQVNCMFSIFTGFMMGIMINLYLNNVGDFNCKKSLFIIPIILYIFLGIYTARKSLLDLNDIEKLHIINQK